MENPGAFLSLGAGLTEGPRFWLLTGAVGGLLAGLFVYLLLGKDLSTLQVVTYALVLAGGASNWADRVLRGGAVVDFMNVGLGPSLRSGIFNVADLAIDAGAALILIQAIASKRRSKVG